IDCRAKPLALGEIEHHVVEEPEVEASRPKPPMFDDGVLGTEVDEPEPKTCQDQCGGNLGEAPVGLAPQRREGVEHAAERAFQTKAPEQSQGDAEESAAFEDAPVQEEGDRPNPSER